jgi:hypothetical protein
LETEEELEEEPEEEPEEERGDAVATTGTVSPDTPGIPGGPV